MQGSGEVQKCIKRNQEHFHWETVVGWKFISLDTDSSGAPALAGLYLFWPRHLHFGPVFHPKVFSAANTFCISDCAAPAILWSCFLPKRISWRKGVDRKDKKSNNSHHWNVKKTNSLLYKRKYEHCLLFLTRENSETLGLHFFLFSHSGFLSQWMSFFWPQLSQLNPFLRQNLTQMQK